MSVIFLTKRETIISDNMKSKLKESDYIIAAKILDCKVAAIKAVTEVESPRGGFQGDGQPTILFERHKFHQFTGGRFSRSYPNISNVRPGGYGRYKDQHGRLQQAVQLNRTAALKSASWGRFQIMGFNYRLCGFSSLQSFINAMYKSEREQLMAFVQFIKKSGLADELRRHDWAGFARAYNGKNYRINNYDRKLAAAYKKYSK